MFDGHQVMLGRDLARLCYGKAHTGKLGELRRRYWFDFYRLGASNHYGTEAIKNHFGIPKSTSQLNLAAWPHVLPAGAKGETEFAHKVWISIHNARCMG